MTHPSARRLRSRVLPKILSIRKVLFHELAHNEFSEHDDNFYRLMRQVTEPPAAYRALRLAARNKHAERSRSVRSSEGEFPHDFGTCDVCLLAATHLASEDRTRSV